MFISFSDLSKRRKKTMIDWRNLFFFLYVFNWWFSVRKTSYCVAHWSIASRNNLFSCSNVSRSFCKCFAMEFWSLTDSTRVVSKSIEVLLKNKEKSMSNRKFFSSFRFRWPVEDFSQPILSTKKRFSFDYFLFDCERTFSFSSAIWRWTLELYCWCWFCICSFSFRIWLKFVKS